MSALFFLMILCVASNASECGAASPAENKQLTYYCKGLIERDNTGRAKLKIIEYVGDRNKAVQAVQSHEEDLNKGLYGPKAGAYKVFFLGEIEKKAIDGAIKSLSFGSMGTSYDDEFNVSGLNRRCHIREIESFVFQYMLKPYVEHPESMK